MKTMSRLSAAERRQQNVGSRTSAAERRQQNVGSRASAAARGHGRACRRCDQTVHNVFTLFLLMYHKV